MSIFNNQSALIADRFKITDTTFPLQAKGILTLTGQPLDTETVTIDSKVYMFQTVLTNVNGNVLIGASASDSIDNLIAGITLGAGSGTLYAALTTLHPTVKASAGAGDTMDAAARLAGVPGNLITTVEGLTNGSWATPTLTGGVSADTWLDFNKIDRIPSRLAVNSVEVYEESDFGVVVGGVITLSGSRQFIVKDTIVMVNRLVIDNGATIEIIGDSLLAISFIYVGTGTLFSSPAVGAGTSRFYIQNLSILLTTSGSTAFDLRGDITSGFSEINFSVLDLIWTDNGGTLGTITNFAIVITELMIVIGFEEGLTFQDCIFFRVDDCSFQVNPPLTGPFIKVLGNRTIVVQLTRMGWNTTDASDSGLFLSPNISPFANCTIETIDMQVGDFFESGNTGSITLFADASIGATAITSVSSGTAIPEGGNFARFNHAGTDVFVGQRVVTSTFTPEVTYNQTLIVTVTGVGFFEGIVEATGVIIDFTSSDTGSYLSNSVTVTSAAHGESNGQPLLITGTIDYDGGFGIYNSLTNTYQINAVFVTAETVGLWDTGSLTQRERRVNARDNGRIQDSMNVAFGGMNANAGATTIALADTYQALDFNTMVQDPSTELWTLIDVTNGIFRYDGVNPVAGALQASITCVKSGSTQIYRFTDSINGVIPVFATASYVPVEIKTTQINVTLLRPVNVVTGDTIQIMGAGDGTSNDLTITDFFLQIII